MNNEPDRTQGIRKNPAETDISNHEHLIPYENALAAAQATLHLVPIIGGVLASVLGEATTRVRQRRMLQFTREVAESLAKVSNRLEAEYLKSEEFMDVFSAAYKGAVNTHFKDKRDCYRAVLVNRTLEPANLGELGDYCLTLLDMMSILHIRVLRAIYGPLQSVTWGWSDDSALAVWSKPSVADYLRKVLNIVAGAEVAVVADLYARDLVSQFCLRELNTRSDESLEHALVKCQSDFGREFYKIISLED